MHLNPAEFVIYKYGGLRRAARVIGLDPSSVSKWQLKGTIPSGHQKNIILKAREAGLRITASDIIFGKEVGDIKVLEIMPWLHEKKYYPHDYIYQVRP